MATCNCMGGPNCCINKQAVHHYWCHYCQNKGCAHCAYVLSQPPYKTWTSNKSTPITERKCNDG